MNTNSIQTRVLTKNVPSMQQPHMAPQRRAIGRAIVALVAILIIIVGEIGFVSFRFQPSKSTASSPSTSTITVCVSSSGGTQQTVTCNSPNVTYTGSTSCIIAGQPGGIFLRILSDSTLKPVVGAYVTATNRPAYCNNIRATNQTTETFATNGTE